MTGFIVAFIIAMTGLTITAALTDFPENLDQWWKTFPYTGQHSLKVASSTVYQTLWMIPESIFIPMPRRGGAHRVA